MSQQDKDHIAFEQLAFSSVTANGFQDVAILTKGEAGGHNMIIDEVTIEQFVKLSLGKTISAYLTHEDAMSASGQPKDRLGKEIGMFSGFYRDGDKVRAKNFTFLNSFAKSDPKTHTTLLEMASGFATTLGISPFLLMSRSWVLSDKSEVLAKLGEIIKPIKALFEYPSMRIAAIMSCDFVKTPAANFGLFEAKIDANPIVNMSESILLSKHTEEIVSLSTKHSAAIALMEASVTDLTGQIAAKSAELKSLTDQLAAQTAATEVSKEETSAAMAKVALAEQYDMRKAGAPALHVALAALANALPVAAANDAGKWAQYHALLGSNVELAAEFKLAYLTRK